MGERTPRAVGLHTDGDQLLEIPVSPRAFGGQARAVEATETVRLLATERSYGGALRASRRGGGGSRTRFEPLAVARLLSRAGHRHLGSLDKRAR